MDVDRFFVGPDDTETCALHAAAFSGAERTLEFLSGGIDEYDMNNDAGLCDVDIRDANGWTALHFAAGANRFVLLRFFGILTTSQSSHITHDTSVSHPSAYLHNTAPN